MLFIGDSIIKLLKNVNGYIFVWTLLTWSRIIFTTESQTQETSLKTNELHTQESSPLLRLPGWPWKIELFKRMSWHFWSREADPFSTAVKMSKMLSSPPMTWPRWRSQVQVWQKEEKDKIKQTLLSWTNVRSEHLTKQYRIYLSHCARQKWIL